MKSQQNDGAIFVPVSPRERTIAPFLRRVLTLSAQFPRIRTCSGQINLYRGEIAVTGIQWDDPLPSPLQDAWRSVAECLQPLSTVEVPRFVGCTPADTDHQLHVFCDASQDSYGCAVYLRTQHAQSKQVSCHLLYTEMRLTPSGSRHKNLTTSTTPSDVSLPRLELLGVVLGSRASQFVSQELKLSISSRTIWTDSKCVLLWLKSISRKAIFVENRITELRNDSTATFRYVRSADYPANLVTVDSPFLISLTPLSGGMVQAGSQMTCLCGHPRSRRHPLTSLWLNER